MADPFDFSGSDPNAPGFLGQSVGFWRDLAQFGGNLSAAANARTSGGFLANGSGLAGPLGVATGESMQQGRQNAAARSQLAGQSATTQGQLLSNQLAASSLPLQQAKNQMLMHFYQHPELIQQLTQGGGMPSMAPAGNDLSGAAHTLESGGSMAPGTVGDGGAAAGPMQVHQGALTDVNQKWGTNYTLDQLSANPQLGKQVGDMYLSMQQQRFPGRPDLALAAYNAGPTRTAQAVQSGAGVSGLPQSTQQYVQHGMALAGGQSTAGGVSPQQALATAQQYERQANGLELAKSLGMPIPGDPAALRAAAQQYRALALAGPMKAAEAEASNAADYRYAGPKAAAVAQAELPAQMMRLGFQIGQNGQMMTVPGGPADPAYVGQKAATEARAKVAPALMEKGFRLNADGTIAPVGGGAADPAYLGAVRGAESKAAAPYQIQRAPPGSIMYNALGQAVGSTPMQSHEVILEGPHKGTEVTVLRDPLNNKIVGDGGGQPGANGLPAGSIPTALSPGEKGFLQGAPEITRNFIEHDNKMVDEDLSHVIENVLPAKQQLLELRNLNPDASTGAAGELRMQFKNWVNTFAPDFVSQITGNASPAQEFNKIALMGAGKQERGDLGSKGGFRAMEMYVRANPNIDNQETANRDMANVLLISHQYHEDYATGATDFFNKQIQGLQDANSTKGYKKVSVYDQQYIQKMRPELYVSAMGALNGKPYAEWSKGLTAPQMQIVGGILQRADPSAVVDVNGQRVPVTKFTKTIGPGDIMGGGNAP